MGIDIPESTDHHLRKVFTKLDISSHNELEYVPPRGPPAIPTR
jgi:hypothetical protein